jgi:hypothetical protein
MSVSTSDRAVLAILPATVMLKELGMQMAMVVELQCDGNKQLTGTSRAVHGRTQR